MREISTIASLLIESARAGLLRLFFPDVIGWSVQRTDGFGGRCNAR